MIPTTAEYDAFGPWVLTVSSPDQVPPVFRAHPIDLVRAHVVLKVPRDVLRRDVTPRSQLYDVLLVLDQDALEVLTRVGHRFAVQRIRREDVAAVDTGTELLDGWLVVLGRDGSRIDVRFNGASLPRMTDLADRLLGWRDAPATAHGGRPLAQDAIGLQDVGLVNAHNGLPALERTRRVLVAYPQRIPGGQHRTWLQRLLRGPALLSGAVVSSDARHTVVIARRHWLHRSRTPDLSLRRIVLPPGWTTASTADHATLHDVVDLRVRLGAVELPLTVPVGEAGAVASVLGGMLR